MTGGPAALEAARTEGPGCCGLQGHADCAVTLRARDSSSWFGQQGQDSHEKHVDEAMNKVRERRRWWSCPAWLHGSVAVEIPLLD